TNGRQVSRQVALLLGIETIERRTGTIQQALFCLLPLPSPTRINGQHWRFLIRDRRQVGLPVFDVMTNQLRKNGDVKHNVSRYEPGAATPRLFPTTELFPHRSVASLLTSGEIAARTSSR